MGFQYRRRVARRKIGPATTWSNVSGSGVSQSLRLGPITVNTRGEGDGADTVARPLLAREAVNRDDLDGWFARADDVLTDWHGSPDAMNTVQRPAVLGVGWLTLPWSSPHADVLGDLQAAIRASQHTAYFLPVSDEILIEWGRDGAGINAVHSPPVDAPPHPWERALEARRTRNTGPPDRHRLDGRRTRR